MQKWDTFLILGAAALLLLGGAGWMAARKRSGPPTGPVRVVALGDSLTAAGGYCKELQRMLPAGSSVRCLGAPGEGVWTFEAVESGAAELSMEYSQPWEEGEKGEWTYTLTVTVE